MIRPERARRRLSLASLVFITAAVAVGCSALTPATDGPSSTQSSSGNEGTAGSSDGETPEFTTTTIEYADPIWQELQLELVPIVQLEEPIALASRSGSLNLYVAERVGRVRVVERTVSDKGLERTSLASRPVLDISEMVSTNGEGGLLGLAFSTDGRHLYVSYTDLDGDSVVAEYLVNRGQRADLDSRRELLRVEQPESNHNGGSIKVGEDGFLYMAFGDGGSQGDPDGHGQNLESRLGKILRVDTVADGDRPFSIPDGNPFLDGGGLEEIWLWGVRNPWKFSFDRQTGDMWVADVGQSGFEEITFMPVSQGAGRGANLGWNDMEAHVLFAASEEPEDHVGPLYAYDHSNGGCSITGGYVYRGKIIALLEGVYLFGDLCTGEINGLQRMADGVLVRPLQIAAAEGTLVSFGEGPDGELFVLERDGPEGLGTVYRIEPAEADNG